MTESSEPIRMLKWWLFTAERDEYRPDEVRLACDGDHIVNLNHGQLLGLARLCEVAAEELVHSGFVAAARVVEEVKS